MTDSPSLELYCGKSFGQRGLWFGIDSVELASKTVSTATDLTFTERELYEETKPLFHMKNEQVQTLLDQIWNLGYRPSSGECSIGQIGAVKDHLTDMQKIVSKVLKVEL